MTKSSPPPKGLSAEAKKFWHSIVNEYDIADAAGMRLLQSACEALDAARDAEARVKKDGSTHTDKHGRMHVHPLIAVARASHRAMLQSLKALNLDIEPLRSGVGRPPKG